jgi:ATP-dependent RNA helicase RhlE
MSFATLALSAPIQKALSAKNYTTPTPVQAATIPHVLAGRDVLGCAQTGTGKTAAFALPILEHLTRNPQPRVRHTPRVLVLAPTRELAGQIKASFDAYGIHLQLRSTAVFGGVGQVPQEKAMLAGPEILVATPGRLLDLMGSGHVRLERLEILVLDEADRMLDMGFIHDVRRIIARVPSRRQTLFFSATMPSSVRGLAAGMLRSPQEITITPESTTVEKIDQTVCHLPTSQKREMLRHMLRAQTDGLTLVFSGTKHGANRIADGLIKNGIQAEAIHGNKSQGARTRALENFRSRRCRVLVATDIAARGIDVKGVELVINYDLPKEPECYVHRIGRTARAGAGGKAVSLVGEQDGQWLRQIERTIRMMIPVDDTHPFHRSPGAAAPRDSQSARRGAPARESRHHRDGGRGAQPHCSAAADATASTATATENRPQRSFGNYRAKSGSRRQRLRFR